MSEQRWEADSEYQEHVIAEVRRTSRGYDIQCDGFWLGLQIDWEPRVGDRARLFGRGFGYPVRGVVVLPEQGGMPLVAYYLTKDEQREEAAKRQQSRDAEKQANLDATRGERDARWNALPPEFHARRDRFTAAKGDIWRRDYEPYELFCCEQAHAIATALHANGMGVAEFHRIASFADQRRIVPALSEDHSGNSFGMACRLAALFLTSRDDVAREHGALVPLVGCEDYGCTHEPSRTDVQPPA